jgi:hypothetical protein
VFDIYKIAFALLVAFFQPFEGFVPLAASRINVRHLVGVTVRVLGD